MMILVLMNMTLFTSWICVKELKINRVAATQAFRMEYLNATMEEEKKSFLEVVACVSSGQRIVDYEVLEKEMKYHLSDQDYDALLRIVEAEAGGEDADGKLLVANVVLNRVNDRLGDGSGNAERAGRCAVYPDGGRAFPERDGQQRNL